MRTRVITLESNDAINVNVSSFEEAFGEYSELKGKGRARRKARQEDRSQKKKERKTTRVSNRQEARAEKQQGRIATRGARKLAKQQVKTDVALAKQDRRGAKQSERQGRRNIAQSERQGRRNIAQDERIGRRERGLEAKQYAKDTKVSREVAREAMRPQEEAYEEQNTGYADPNYDSGYVEDNQGYVDQNGYSEDSYGDEGYVDQNGYSEDSYGDEGYSEDSYGDEGYGDYGYGDEGYGDEGYDDYGYGDEGYDDYGYGDEGYDDYGYDSYGYEEGYGADGMEYRTGAEDTYATEIFGAEDYFLNAIGQKQKINPKITDFAKKIEWNKEMIDRLNVASMKSANPQVQAKNKKIIAERKSRIKELSENLSSFSNLDDNADEAAKFNREREIRRAKCLARQQRNAIAIRAKDSKANAVKRIYGGSEMPKNIDMSETKPLAPNTGFIGYDNKKDFDAPQTRKVEIKSNFVGEDPKTQSPTKTKLKPRTKTLIAVGVGLAVAVGIILAIRHYNKKK